MHRRSRLIELMVGALSVVIGFNLDLPRLLGNLSTTLGFDNPSAARSIVINGGVPLAIIVLSSAALFVYNVLIWPVWPGSGCRRGLWMYALLARTETEEILVAGWFQLIHTPYELRIDDALAYYVDEDQLALRGEWSSEAVWAGSRRITFAFEMRAQGPVREPLPSQYQGLMQLATRGRATGAGRDLWTGYFHDLGDRRGVHGPVAGLRCRRPTRSKTEKEMLSDQLAFLRARVVELGGGGTKAALPVPKEARA